MFAFALTALFVLIGLASVIVLVDSGLRWQSAYGRLKSGTSVAIPFFGAPHGGMTWPVVRGGYRTARMVSPPRPVRAAMRAAA